MVDNHEKTQRAKFDLLSGITSREDTNANLQIIRDQLAEIADLLRSGGHPDLAESAERIKDDIAADIPEDSTIMK
ncbi:hypothetical protein, partial [Escherichia coli]|uniref:hypothetical protein n=1 Tax=Escherichia coli TaxID=562 RepID=UPI0013B39B28